jgi:hypothetical protein
MEKFDPNCRFSSWQRKEDQKGNPGRALAEPVLASPNDPDVELLEQR